MSKNHKRSKRLKSEKSKVKLKTKRTIDRLPKGLNITNTSFKVKKILIREQLKQQNETQLISNRKLNIDDLLVRFRHHNSIVRQDALRQLKDILLRNSPKSLHSQLNSLLHGIVTLSLDKDKNVRTSSFHALDYILGCMSSQQLTPLRGIVTSYLSCAMTHIDPCVKQDSLLFLDVLLQNCDYILARDSHKILPNFLSMICKLHNQVRPGETRLTTMLNSNNTDIKWKIKVLERLANMFISITNYYKFYTSTRSNMLSTVTTKRYTRYIPIYSNSVTQVYEINLDQDVSSIGNHVKEVLSMEQFMKYIGLLMPLMSDIWLEVCPNEKVENYDTEMTISSEAAALLKSIVIIIQSIVEYIDTLNDHDDYDINHIRHWFKDTFHNAYMKTFLLKFPYTKIKSLDNKSRKYEKDFSQDFTDGCLEHNLGLCQIHIWFTSLFNRNEQFSKSIKTCCVSIINYLNDVIENWYELSSSILSQLIKLIRALFLKAGPVWHTNCISLSHTLRLIVEASYRLSPKRELQSHLYLIIGEIMLKSDLKELHREKLFQNFVTILPSLLLRSSIDDAVIQMISQIVLRFKEWIQEELMAKHESIIENIKKIDIINSYDDKQSRLMICNLFYFVDSHIYY